MAGFVPRGGAGRVFDASAPSGVRRSGAYERSQQQERKRMLDLSREGHFKYDLREVFARGTLPPEQITAFIATVITKGQRVSTVEAKDWVTSKLQEQVITKAERDAINTLIDRYSKWR